MDPSDILDQALALCELKLFSDLSTSANCCGGWMDFALRHFGHLVGLLRQLVEHMTERSTYVSRKPAGEGLLQNSAQCTGIPVAEFGTVNWGIN
ncbi:hypothetical protein M5K25_007825 [Dendrobium thyrsiflorum]|uniref:Uncharacterized protein n=1 Tax=Dendrobium thyrsiflorum TaxID=117978 RepID=A0ABD0VFA3_DENTH